MRVLLFHGDLTQPSGGEVNVRDWALGLKARGHDVSIYATRLGPLAQQIRSRGITVVDDPSAISDAPDVIMGQGVNELATLIARFPRSAGIQVAQLWDHWNSSACPLPQVVLHVAVDRLNFEMLANEFGVPREKIRLVYNAVDVTRIAARTKPLGPRPRRALVFAKNQSDYRSAIVEACASRNIEVDFVGSWINRPVADPLQLIPEYDLVIGSARTAIEGAACGAAVVVADGRGLAGMLTTSNFETFRDNNFGREVLIKPMTAELVGEAIDLYDPADAREVSRLILASASLDQQLERIEAIFAEAIELLGQAKLGEETIHQTLSSYLSRHLPRAVEGEESPRHRQIQPDQKAALEEQASILAQSVDARIASLERGIAAISDQSSAAAHAVDARLASLEHGVSAMTGQIEEVAAQGGHLERRLSGLFDVAAAIERNQVALNLLRPFARALRAVTRTRPR